MGSLRLLHGSICPSTTRSMDPNLPLHAWWHSPAARPRSATAAVAAAAACTAVGPGKHYVVVGAGLAGLATAYHLLKQSSSHIPVRVTVYDAVGIGAGGSGAAAGLLHPFTPTGKLLWRAQEAMEAALELLEAAEAAAQQDPSLKRPISWHTGMLKPASNNKQSQSLWKLYGNNPQQQQQVQHSNAAETGSHPPSQLTRQQQQQLRSMLRAGVVGVDTAQQLLPGLQFKHMAAGQATAIQAHIQSHQQQHNQPHDQGQQQQQHPSQGQQEQQPQQQQRQQPVAEQQHEQQQQQQLSMPPEGWSPDVSAALHVPGGITLQPMHYMEALWAACQQAAAGRQDGSSAELKIQQLHSLAELVHSSTPGTHTAATAHPLKQTAQQKQQQQLSHAGSSAAATHTAGTAQPLNQTGQLGQAEQQQAMSAQQQQQRQEQSPEQEQILTDHQQQQQTQQQVRADTGRHEWQHRVDAIVVAAGAAIGSLAELEGQVPLNLCQGYTVDMVPPTSAAAAADTGAAADTAAVTGSAGCSSAAGVAANATAQRSRDDQHTTAATAPAAAVAGRGGVAVVYPASAPSLLGSPYVASQGGQVLVVGATKQYDYTTQQAVAELSRVIDPSILHGHHHHLSPQQQRECAQGGGAHEELSPRATAAAAAPAAAAAAAEGPGSNRASEVVSAAAELLRDAGAVWPGIQSWTLSGIRSGVRALTPKDHKGMVPFAGLWGSLQVGRRQEQHGAQQQHTQTHQQELGQQEQGQRQGREQQQETQQHTQQQELGQQQDTGDGTGVGHCSSSSSSGSSSSSSSVPVWLLVGLGARGLVYHAWLGQLIAAAVLSNSQDHLPRELLSWQQQPQQQQRGRRSFPP